MFQFKPWSFFLARSSLQAEMEEDHSMFPEPFIHDLPSRTSGHAKRRRKSALPRALFVYEMTTNIIFAAILLTGCASVAATPDSLYWSSERLVRLVEPVELEDGDYKRRGLFVELKPSAELAIRRMHTTAGGSLNDHFQEHASEVWLGWPADRDMLSSLARSREGHCTFSSPVAYASMLGVVPEISRFLFPFPGNR